MVLLSLCVCVGEGGEGGRDYSDCCLEALWDILNVEHLGLGAVGRTDVSRRKSEEIL